MRCSLYRKEDFFCFSPLVRDQIVYGGWAFVLWLGLLIGWVVSELGVFLCTSQHSCVVLRVDFPFLVISKPLL